MTDTGGQAQWHGGDAAYGCQRQGCRREVKFSSVEYMGKINADSFALKYKCACSPGEVITQYFLVDHKAIGRLLGRLRPVLPYSAPPNPPEPLRPEQERVLRLFRWECEQLESVAEFLLLATRPPLQ